MRKILITGNKIIDGIITFLIGLGFIGVCALVVKFYGFLNVWWQIWGHPLSDIFIGLWAALFAAGFIYFYIGFRLFISGIFETLLIPEKLLYVAVIYIPAIMSITILAFYAILPPALFAELFKWLITFFVGAVSGYLVAKIE